jgi:hypothetical protein
MIIMFIIIGGVVILLSILGCIAALVDSRRTIIIYYGGILALFLFVVICVVIGFTYRSKLVESLRSDFAASVPMYDPNYPDATETLAWDTMQRTYECCGVNSNVNGSDTTFPFQVWKTNKNLNSGSADSKYEIQNNCW